MTRDRAARRCGFTLMELLTTMIVVGILAGLALPTLRAAIYRADASRIAADMTVVRTAIYQFREENEVAAPRGQRVTRGGPRP